MATVQALLATMSRQEARVLRLRFGILHAGQWVCADQVELHGYELTLEEVAELMGVTRERVRQIEGRALRKMRHPTRSKFLKPFSFGNESSGLTVEMRAQKMRVVRLDGRPHAKMTPEAEKFFKEFPIQENERETSVWLLTWTGGLTPRGAMLGNRKVEWVSRGVVCCDTGKEIGTYHRLGTETKDNAKDRQMIIWSRDPKVTLPGLDRSQGAL
jgi:hypothetical protein